MAKRKDRNQEFDEDAINEPAEKPSRSAKKRASSALQKLGEELAEMPASSREELNLPPELSEALKLHDKITDREGARRQRQYIGRLMRGLDAKSIEMALARRRHAQKAETAKFHRAEKLRDKIIDSSESAMPGILESLTPQLKNELDAETTSRLNELAHKARLERSLGASAKKSGPRSSRQLYRLLAEIIK